LIEKLGVLIPELLELNNRSADPNQPIDLPVSLRRKTEKSEERIRLGARRTAMLSRENTISR
jgi:hypothetical protein